MSNGVIGFCIGVTVILCTLNPTVKRMVDEKARTKAAAYGCECVIAVDGEFQWKTEARHE